MTAKRTIFFGDVVVKIYEKSFTVNGQSVYPSTNRDYPEIVEEALGVIFKAGKRNVWTEFKKMMGLSDE